MVDLRYKFFRSAERAANFAAEVGGEVFDKNHWEYELAAERVVEYGEDYKELFPYMVHWDAAKKDKMELTEEEKELIRLGEIYNRQKRGEC